MLYINRFSKFSRFILHELGSFSPISRALATQFIMVSLTVKSHEIIPNHFDGHFLRKHMPLIIMVETPDPHLSFSVDYPQP